MGWLVGVMHTSLLLTHSLACSYLMQFCDKHTLRRLQSLPEVAGCEAKLRMDGDKPYVTDNSNYIVDLYFQVCALAMLTAEVLRHKAMPRES